MTFKALLAKVSVLAVMASLLVAVPVMAAGKVGLAEASSDLKLDGENSSLSVEVTFEKDITDAKMAVKKAAHLFGLTHEDIAAADLDVNDDMTQATLKFTHDTDAVSFTFEAEADVNDGTIEIKVDKQGPEAVITKFIHKVHANFAKMHSMKSMTAPMEEMEMTK